MDDTERFDYGKAVEATCANCGVVQIPSGGFSNISCPLCNGVIISSSSTDSHSHMRSSDNRERNLLLQDDAEEINKISLGCRPEDHSDFTELVTESLGHLSIECTTSGLPLQESSEANLTLGQVQSHQSKLSKTPTEGNDENGNTDICQTCGTCTLLQI